MSREQPPVRAGGRVPPQPAPAAPSPAGGLGELRRAAAAAAEVWETAAEIFWERDEYAARLKREFEALPPGAASADLRAMHESRALRFTAVSRLGLDHSARVPALAQAAADLFRSIALEARVIGDLPNLGANTPALWAATGGGPGRVPFATAAAAAREPLELALLGSLDVWRAAAAALELESRDQDAPLFMPLEPRRALHAALARAAGFWADAGRAEALAARLAALGVERAELACADARYALLCRADQIAGGLPETAPAARLAARKEHAAVDPLCFMSYKEVVEECLKAGDAREGLA
jgi:hypothetical protein